MFRHALAPGTFDPPGFRLGDCGTQRNLNDEGRPQARRIGEWFQARQLRPEKVLSSPWVPLHRQCHPGFRCTTGVDGFGFAQGLFRDHE